VTAPSEQQVAEYRAALAQLMRRCLERIRAMPVPADTPPQQEGPQDG
jgi:hypothetical protein